MPGEGRSGVGETGGSRGQRGPARQHPRQAWIGLAVAGLILGAWLGLHLYGVLGYAWGPHSWLTAPALAAVITWLYVGLFIVAHDAMHGSLAPGRPGVNRAIGRLSLFLYAGFSFDALERKHHLHHDHAGSSGDPDFDPRPPHGFVHWYWTFLVTYFGWRQMLFMAVVWNAYTRVFDAAFANVLVFWALPAILSSLQLFLFGTYLPHKPGKDLSADRHRSRSLGYGWWRSFLACYHFGYHHEHHEHPYLPWWRLPEARRG